MNIDWSKAPEGATHYGATSYFNGSPDWCEAFYKSIGGRWLICFPASDDWHGDASKNRDWDERFATLIARPAVWNGEGLPPVGTVCEFQGDNAKCPFDPWHADLHDGMECTVIAHFKSKALDLVAFTFVKPDGNTEVEQSLPGALRPIRTPEQIQRHKDIEVLMRSTDYEFNERQAAIILDAGYKRTEPEQIAAEERQTAVSKMFNDAQVDFSAGDLMSAQEYVIRALAALYDKGYRKEVKP